MVGYPRALRTAHHVVDGHPADARAYVAAQIAEALRTGHAAQAAHWQKVGRFVDRLLAEPEPSLRHEAARHPRPPRYRRVRTPARVPDAH